MVSLIALMATGMSFGPMATSATTPIRAISDQAKSNMAVSYPEVVAEARQVGIACKAKLPYYIEMNTFLTVSAKGQVTLKKSVLAHLGVRPGQKVVVDLRAGGAVQLRPVPSGKISDAFGILPPPDGPALTIEEMNEVIAEGWAGKR